MINQSANKHSNTQHNIIITKKMTANYKSNDKVIQFTKDSNFFFRKECTRNIQQKVQNFTMCINSKRNYASIERKQRECDSHTCQGNLI